MSGVVGARATWALAVGCLVLYVPVRVGSFMTGIFGGGPPPDTRTLVGGIAIIVALFVLHGVVVWGRVSQATRRALLLALVLLTYGPYLVLGPSWAPIGGLLAAAVLLTTSGRRAWLTFTAVVAADVALAAAVLPPVPPALLAFRLQSTFILGLLLFAVARLAQLVQQLDDAREQLAAAEVARYRTDAAEGLHVAIGERLATILVDARRLTTADEATIGRRAAARIAQTSRDAMTAVREVADLQRPQGLGYPTAARPPAEDAADHGSQDGHWVLGRRIIVVAVASFCGTFLINLWVDAITDPTRWMVAIAACVLVGRLHVHHAAPRAGGEVPDGWPVTLTLQVLVTVAATAYFGMNANPLPVLAIGAVLVRVRPPWSVVLAVGGTVALGVAGQPAVDQLGWHLYRVAITLGSVIAFYALCRFPDVARELHATRRSVASVAVARDRHRVARDVHDLLGSRLAAIGLHAERLDRQLARGDHGTVDGGDLAGLAEQALTDLRSITRGLPTLALDAEVAAADALLAAAGVDRHLQVDPVVLSPDVETVLATVLREAATNIVRHATARTATIELRTDGDVARLEIRNDGVTPGEEEVAAARRGNGLANLAVRVAAVGGVLAARATGEGTFTLEVSVPTGRSRSTVLVGDHDAVSDVTR